MGIMKADKESHGTNVSDFASLHLHKTEDTNTVGAQNMSAPPLVLLYTWLGASPSAVLQYVQLYHDKSVDVLVIHGYLSGLFMPSNALRLARKILNYLMYDQCYYRKYLVHAFSIGAYNFTMCTILAKEQREIYGDFFGRLRGMVLDSFVIGSWEYMARGISKTISDHRSVQWLAFKTALFYLTWRPRSTREFYRRAIEHITDAPVDKPALFFFSLNDRMCDVSNLQDLLKKWQSVNVSPVLTRHWPESVHTAHLKYHRKEYLQTWNEFCSSLPDFFRNSINISKDKLSKL